jgi:surface protein
MKAMFYGATSFNQPIGNWDLSNVNNISFMLYDAITFNQNLSNWEIKNIRNHFSFSFNTPNWLLSKPI